MRMSAASRRTASTRRSHGHQLPPRGRHPRLAGRDEASQVGRQVLYGAVQPAGGRRGRRWGQRPWGLPPGMQVPCPAPMAMPWPPAPVESGSLLSEHPLHVEKGARRQWAAVAEGHWMPELAGVDLPRWVARGRASTGRQKELHQGAQVACTSHRGSTFAGRRQAGTGMRTLRERGHRMACRQQAATHRV